MHLWSKKGFKWIAEAFFFLMVISYADSELQNGKLKNSHVVEVSPKKNLTI